MSIENMTPIPVGTFANSGMIVSAPGDGYVRIQGLDMDVEDQVIGGEALIREDKLRLLINTLREVQLDGRHR